MLTDTQVAQYHADGYVVPDFRLPEHTLASIRADHDRLIANHPEYRNLCPTVLAYDLAFLNYARIPQIVDMVGQVLGPDFALWNSSFFAKPATNGQATPWHQDGEYWPIRPVATCTVWIAVDAATQQNGCLRIVKGSHKARSLFQHQTNPSKDLTLDQELPLTDADAGNAVELVLEPGQMSLHDVFLVHGSAANTSPNPRRGLTLRYMPTTSVFDRTLAVEQGRGHEARTLYLMSGTDRSGKNDFRMRR